jgi:hypothetical protein
LPLCRAGSAYAIAEDSVIIVMITISANVHDFRPRGRFARGFRPETMNFYAG